MTEEQAAIAEDAFAKFRIWLVINSEKERAVVEGEVGGGKVGYGVRVITLEEIRTRIEALGDVLS